LKGILATADGRIEWRQFKFEMLVTKNVGSWADVR
jgi:hypothetical protein